MKTIKLTNNFHNTSTSIRGIPDDVEPGDVVEISEHQYRRAIKALCGMSDCQCGATRGCASKLQKMSDRGPWYVSVG